MNMNYIPLRQYTPQPGLEKSEYLCICTKGNLTRAVKVSHKNPQPWFEQNGAEAITHVIRVFYATRSTYVDKGWNAVIDLWGFYVTESWDRTNWSLLAECLKVEYQ